MIATRALRWIVLMLVCLPAAGNAAEWWVDQKAAPGGDGSQAKPFRLVGDAVKTAKGGDTVTIRAGVYRESVTVAQSGTAEQPTVIRAAAGERVVLSGFAPVAGWQVHRGPIYTTTVDWPAGDLFVGCRPQPVSRWPDRNAPWRTVKEVQAAAGTLRDGGDLARERLIEAVAARPASARLYLYVRAGNYFSDAPLTGLDMATATLTAGQARSLGSLRAGDRYQITNHESLILKPGEWAYERLDEKRTRLYFRPADPAELQRTQARVPEQRLLYVGHWQNKVSHVRVEGLEVAGSGGMGVQIGNADGVTLSRCTVHHNGGNGVSVRGSANVNVLNNVVFANGSGVGVASSHDVRVESNEIAGNMVDGLIFAGNVSGRPGGEPNTRDVVARRNYIHHHLLLGHPDNVQTYRGVENLTLEENVLLWGGQAVMTEETDHSAIRNCAIVGTGAVAVIFGHGNASDWKVEGSTIGLGGWGGISMSGKDYRLGHNIILQNAIGLGESITSDYNLYAAADDTQSICLVSKPKWQRFRTPEETAAATGQEKHSLRADPLFRSAPARQAVAVWKDENALDRLFVRQAGAKTPTEGFAAGDRIEINGDGVLRRVTGVDADSIRFEPALPELPLREGLIWNWRDAANCVLDLRVREGSPALKAGQEGRRVGADLDIPAFQRGDFDGDGRRDIPELPEDLKACWPNPNAVVLPVGGA